MLKLTKTSYKEKVIFYFFLTYFLPYILIKLKKFYYFFLEFQVRLTSINKFLAI
jgi:hypothetical protein